MEIKGSIKGLYFKDIFYLESQEARKFLFFTSNTFIGDLPQKHILVKELILYANKFNPGPMTFEIEIEKGEILSFKKTDIKIEDANLLMSKTSLNRFSLNLQNWPKNPSLFYLLKAVVESFFFRRRSQKGDLNWKYIFLFYYFFAINQSRQKKELSFISFLEKTNTIESWYFPLALEHIINLERPLNPESLLKFNPVLK